MKQPIIYFWNAFLVGNLWTNVVKWPGLDTIFYIDFRFDTLQFRSIVIYLKRRCASVWWRFGRCVVGFFGKKRITSFSLRRFYRFSLFLIKLKFSFDGDWRLRKKNIHLPFKFVVVLSFILFRDFNYLIHLIFCNFLLELFFNFLYFYPIRYI
jgi:hypothetical protein